MNLRLKAKDLILKTLVAVTTTLIAVPTLAATEGSDVVEDYRTPVSDIVEMRIPMDMEASYKKRRNTNGFMFGLNYENAEMYKYVSILDFTTPYQDMFGSSEIPIYNVQLSYKYNFSLGSLAATGTLGYGTYSSDISGTMRTLSFTKYGISASYVMDMLFDEPYAAPYVTFGVNQFNIMEKNGEDSESTGIEAAYFYTVGVLIQLNWLDGAVSHAALKEYGLQNTYLDVFMTQFQPSLDAEDPNTETKFAFGAGMRMEF
jgi:hypothetical protein